jgi:hypothetical protein
MDRNNLQIADLIIGWLGENAALVAKVFHYVLAIEPHDDPRRATDRSCLTGSRWIHSRRPTGMSAPLRPRRGG